ncbi:unnamed protein product [Strongylus vulgaris]|uniref:Secreted protein n=1 Tax=Strongylus vulgaris TaxID=40348 RepID=A0A3P7IVW1_STRVU|nr:unnamed protein product [Strongylus vulgaris]
MMVLMVFGSIHLPKCCAIDLPMTTQVSYWNNALLQRKPLFPLVNNCPSKMCRSLVRRSHNRCEVMCLVGMAAMVYDRREWRGRLVAPLDGGKIAEGRKRLGERALIVKLWAACHMDALSDDWHTRLS